MASSSSDEEWGTAELKMALPNVSFREKKLRDVEYTMTMTMTMTGPPAESSRKRMTTVTRGGKARSTANIVLMLREMPALRLG